MVRLARHVRQQGRLTQGVMAIVFVALLLSALATDAHRHPRHVRRVRARRRHPARQRLARELTDRLEDLVVVLLLPAFFAFTGMRTQIGLRHRRDMAPVRR